MPFFDFININYFRYIHFVFEFCDTRTWYIMLFLLLWLCGGLAAIIFCLISSTGSCRYLKVLKRGVIYFSCMFSDPTADSILTVKNNSTEMMVTASDQAVCIFVPVLVGVFLPVN